MGTLIGVLLYLAVLVFVVGTLRKILRYAATPAPLKIPTTPAPTTRSGVLWRLAKEVVLFESLFKASKWTWIFGWAFHAGLFLALLTHLRYVVEPIWWWVLLVPQISHYAGMLMLFGLTGLLARRFLVDRVRYISAPSDFLMLVFLMALAASGLGIKYWSPANIWQVREFALSFISLDIGALAFNPVLFVHIVLAAVLLLIFPFSKLLHAPGLFFSPSRNQVDNPRERRHIAKWAKSLDGSRSSSSSSASEKPRG